MKNFVQPGNTVTVDAPTGGAASGDGVLIGSLFGVAAYTAPENSPLEIVTEGVFDLPKMTGETFVQGAKVYWNAAEKKGTSTVSSNSWVGVALQAANTTATIVRLRLNHVPS